jgi:hypothetical protein
MTGMNIEKIKFSRHIIVGFALIVLSLAIFSSIIIRNVEKQGKINLELISFNQPSIYELNTLILNLEELRNKLEHKIESSEIPETYLIKEWNSVFADKIYPSVQKLSTLSNDWRTEYSDKLKETRILLLDSLPNFLPRAGQNVMKEDLNLVFSAIDQNLGYLKDSKLLELERKTQELNELTLKIKQIIVLSIIVVVIIMGIILFFYYHFIMKGFKIISSGIEKLSQGHIPEDISCYKSDVFYSTYKNLNSLYVYLNNLIRLSKQILDKDFSNNIKPLNEDDKLGIALVNLQQDLKQASLEEEKRRKDDQERRWVSLGIAKINDILRISEDKLEELSYELIKEIVNYTDSKLAALFIINENSEESFLQLSAAFAFDRRKYLDRKILMGEGLVGRCAREREILHITEIPENYFIIQSGLGESKPASILFAPLKINEVVYGVLELASFNSYEAYHIKLIESVCENIAISISKLNITSRTAYLIEQTRQQAEELSTQDEEMRQSMEELRANQEQASIREEKLLLEIESLRNKLAKSS